MVMASFRYGRTTVTTADLRSHARAMKAHHHAANGQDAYEPTKDTQSRHRGAIPSAVKHAFEKNVPPILTVSKSTSKTAIGPTTKSVEGRG
jgi:hypothetical protein